MISTLFFLKYIRDFLKVEMEFGTILGPFKELNFTPWAQTSPMLTRPKKNSVKRRVVVNLSFPPGHSINSGITKGWYQGKAFKFTLPSLADLNKRVIQVGNGRSCGQLI